MKIDLISAILTRADRLRLLRDVCDPVTQNVLHSRNEILYTEDIARLIREYSIDYIEASYMTNHSER